MGEAREKRQKPPCFGDAVEACVGASPGSRRRRKYRSQGTEQPTTRDRRRLPPGQSVRWFPWRSSSTESVTRRNNIDWGEGYSSPVGRGNAWVTVGSITGWLTTMTVRSSSCRQAPLKDSTLAK